MYTKTDEKSKNYDRKLVDLTINGCNIARGFSNLFYKHIFETVIKHMDVVWKCPFEARVYKFPRINFSPVILPIKSLKIRNRVDLYAVVINQKEKKPFAFVESHAKYEF